MPKLATRPAMRHLLYDDDMLLSWIRGGYTKADQSRFRYRLEHDQLSLDLMDEVLEKCGFTVAVEKQWNTPNT